MELSNQLPGSHPLTAPVHPPERVTGPPELHHSEGRYPANLSRRTGHPIEDLRQIAMIGIIEASRRFSPERGPFRPYARTYANGEVYHYLRDKGFLIKVPASWRELHARGQKLLRLGTAAADVPERLGVSAERWREIVLACSQRVVAMELAEQD